MTFRNCCAGWLPSSGPRPCKTDSLWATVEIYCLRQMCRQVSESPIVFTGLPVFYMFLTHFYICLSIVLKRVHLDPHPWRSLFACVGAHLCFFPCLSLMWSSFPLLGRSLQPTRSFWKENGFWHALHSHRTGVFAWNLHNPRTAIPLPCDKKKGVGGTRALAHE